MCHKCISTPGAGRFLWLQHHSWCALALADAGAGAANVGAAAVALPAVWQPGVARRGGNQSGAACGVATGIPDGLVGMVEVVPEMGLWGGSLAS